MTNFATYYREAAEALWFISAMQTTDGDKERLRKLAHEYERLATQEDETPQPLSRTA